MMPEQETTMANETKNWVLVSTQIPSDFDVLDFDQEDGGTMPIRSDWNHRVYEVAEFGSFEGVDVTENDRFVAHVCGASLEALDAYGYETNMIGDVRSWDGEYRIVATNGDYMVIPVETRFFRAVEPQRFGFEPFPTWDDEVELGEDLTAQVFGE